ncbi:hypothetical protein C3942_06650 [Solimonas fluminis]|uniref:DUF3592 domain-containing protein n=1 Tax=Solimonas fluminis TaxID=2086571 RepID=A0A2S5THL3_9GAMM|nr:hypothetical protein [Solimonas fluminis]PPE74442.1 hypothetical protein C3942_06650 [Solimonas fluminis]
MSTARPLHPGAPQPALPQGLRSLLGVALIAAALALGAGLVHELRRAAVLDRDGRTAPATLLLEQAQQLPQDRGAGPKQYLYELRYDGHQRRFLRDAPLAPGQPLWVRYDPAQPLNADLYTAVPSGSALQYTGRPLLILWSALAALAAAALGLGLLRRPWQEPACFESLEIQRRDARFGI